MRESGGGGCCKWILSTEKVSQLAVLSTRIYDHLQSRRHAKCLMMPPCVDAYHGSQSRLPEEWQPLPPPSPHPPTPHHQLRLLGACHTRPYAPPPTPTPRTLSDGPSFLPPSLHTCGEESSVDAHPHSQGRAICLRGSDPPPPSLPSTTSWLATPPPLAPTQGV